MRETAMWFPTRADRNRRVQSQKQAIYYIKFGSKKKEDCTIHVAKTKALINCICVFFRICRLFVFGAAAHVD